MNIKLAEFFGKKCYWERKRDKLYKKMFLITFVNLSSVISFSLFISQSGKDNLFSEKGIFIIWVVLILISLLSYVINSAWMVSNFYYQLPRYRQKIDQIDRQIIEELKNNVNH